MALNLIDPPQREPITLAEAKAFLRITDDTENDLLKHLIVTARTSIEAYTTRALIAQKWRLTANAGFCVSLSDSQYLHGAQSRGAKGLELPRSPFIELLGCPQLIDPYNSREIHEYRLDTAGRIARVHFEKELTMHLGGASMIQIDFSAGYGLAPSDVPAPLRHAVLMVLAELYEKRTTANDNDFSPPVLNTATLQLIKPYRVQRLG